MTKKERKMLRRILIAGAIFFIALPLHHLGKLPPLPELLIFAVVYLIIGYDIVWKALQNIRNGQVFDENFLMTIASLGAFALGEHPEGVAVMLFYQVGELFQSRAVSKSRKSIVELMDIRPDYANLLTNSEITQVDPEDVTVGSLIVINPGERVPLDGVVENGSSSLDTSALTGESAPRDVAPGDEIISGCINKRGRLQVRVSRPFESSTVAKILELVETASDKKSRSEAFITKFARYYTPAVVFAAAALAIFAPLITGEPFTMWVSRALTFLVISCPCALVISVPLSFFGGLGGASKAGILIKGGNYLEALAETEVVVFDKTGTLTKGNFTVTNIAAHSGSKEALLHLAAHAEIASSHPIAKSIRDAYGKTLSPAAVSSVEEREGFGVCAQIDGSTVLAGKAVLLEAEGIPLPNALPIGTLVHLAANRQYLGYLLIEDELKPDAAAAIANLKTVGVRKTVMLTGDTDAIGQKVAKKLGLDEAHTQLLPVDKVAQVEALLAEKNPKRSLAFVGDGINDAPVLARSDIGIAMGALGSDAAIEAADVVLMTDEPSKLVTAIKISRKTLRIARQNIVFALGVKAIVLVLGAMGIATMWAAVFADVGVSMLAILNAIRALNIKGL